MPEMNLIHKGSTKDVYQMGDNYVFVFSDRYSVFDWGEMPDLLEHKGSALTRFTKTIYRHLHQQGFATHLLDVATPENQMLIKPFEVLRTQASSMPEQENIFIPLEMIFRLGVAPGSSLLKRDQSYKEFQRFERPMLEFTTKLERFDRPLSHQQARDLAGMNENEWQQLLTTIENIALELQRLFATHGITLWDGKLEFALGEYQQGQRQIILVDSIGPDELRLTKDQVHLSKEVIRQHYRSTHWYQQLDSMKQQYGEKFKEHMAPPQSLPPEFKSSVEQMYLLLADILSHTTGAAEKLQSLLPQLKERQV